MNDSTLIFVNYMVISQIHKYAYSMYVYTNICMTPLDTLCMSLFVVPAELCITMD